MGAEKAALEALREIYVANSSSFPANTLVLVKDALAAKEEYKVRFYLPFLPPSLPPSVPTLSWVLGGTVGISSRRSEH